MIGAVLLLQLNSERISRHFYEQLQQAVDVELGADSASLSFMHGIGLRLDAVRIRHAQYRLQVRHMNINLQLLPLLAGHIRVAALDIHDADIVIRPSSMTPTATAISMLPVQRIRLIRSRIRTAAGRTVLDNLYLDLRDIGPDGESLWELKARQGRQLLSGNGGLRFVRGELVNGFSKLKMYAFELARVAPFAPPALIDWLQGEGSLLSGAVTLDIGRDQRWALFGELELGRAEDAAAIPRRPVLKLRGKLSHSADGGLRWRDSFIYLGEHGVIAIDGACLPHQDCSTQLQAERVPLAEWAPFMPAGVAFYDQLSGLSDLHASIHWNRQQWRGDIALRLNEALFSAGKQRIALPPLQLQAVDLGGAGGAWHAAATIASPEIGGTIRLRNTRQADGSRDLWIDSSDADTALWLPLGNMLLATLELDPTLQATGPIQGRLHLHQQGAAQSLTLDVDATGTKLAYAGLDKAAGVAARCRATLALADGHVRSVDAQQCRLNESGVETLRWSRRGRHRSLQLQQLDLHLQDIRPLLPAALQQLAGRLSGGGDAVWRAGENWIEHLSGQWQLTDIAGDSWQVGGAVKARNGIFSSAKLRVNGIHGAAELYGSFDAGRQHADIDIVSGHLDWNAMPPLNEFWQQLSIRGRIYQARLKLLDNDWRNIRGYYRFRNGRLRLEQLQAELGDGEFASKRLELAPAAAGIAIQGVIRGRGIRLKKLARLHRWLGAAVSGRLQANIELHGMIGSHRLRDWQHSNGDLLIYDGGWKQQQPAASISEQLGIATPALQSYAFSKLDMRFRVERDHIALSHITLVHRQQRYRGEATISPSQHLTGMLRRSTDGARFRLDSQLPRIRWRMQ